MNTAHHNHPTTAPVSSDMNPSGRSRGGYRGAQREGIALSWPLKTALLLAALVGGFYLLREHWNHVAGNWIYLLLLACPLMHLFHRHGGHGGHARLTNHPTNKKE